MINYSYFNFKSGIYNYNNNYRQECPTNMHNNYNHNKKHTVKNIKFGSKDLFGEIEKLNIPNIHSLPNNSARGECLYHKKNKEMIPIIKNYGIKQIIDLKTADFNINFQNFARENNLDYHSFPIDSCTTPTREIINNLPSFFEQINKGHYYIACAQGMHRTDIALSINYVFNPKTTQSPPILWGHRRKNGLRTDDIVKRLNNIFKELTEIDKSKIGYKNFNEDIFKMMKKMLFTFNL